MPTNTSAVSATAITSLPYSITVDPDFSAQDLWWSYTAPAGQVAIGLFAWADSAGAYRPTLHVWQGSSPSALTDDTPLGSTEAARVPCVLPLTAGQTYYFQIEDATGTDPLGASLEFSVLAAPAVRFRQGDLFIPDDTGGDDDFIGWFPASISDTTGEVRKLVVFSACERGDVLPSGEILVESYSTALGAHLALYDRNLQLVERITGVVTANHTMSIRGDGDSTFYVFDRASDELFTISKTGAVGGTTWAISATGRAIAPSPDGTILYYSDGAAVGAGLKRWDLVAGASLGSVSGSAVANYSIKEDVLPLPDGTLLVAYAKTTATEDYYVRHIQGDGTILRTFALGTEMIERIALNHTQTSFWVYNNDILGGGGNGRSKFTHFNIADGATITSFERYQCNAGFIAANPAEDLPRFSHSFSCPFLILRQDEQTPVVPDESLPCCDTGCECETPSTPAPGVPPTQGGSPSASPIPTSTGAVLPPVNMLAWTALCEGGGTVPTASDASDTESWVS